LDHRGHIIAGLWPQQRRALRQKCSLV
jgi:hypothetical protein